VPITHKLVERLMKAYPADRRMKDRSEDWAHTKSMIDAFARRFDVFSATRSR